MTIKRMSEYKREDYLYDSPDGEKWEIQVLQTDDRKYVIIKKDGGEDGEGHEFQWDVEMLLDIADVVRSATQKTVVSYRSHNLQMPNIVDLREKSNNEDNTSPSDKIQASVEKSMGIDSSAIPPVQSFSSQRRDIASELEQRKNTPQANVSVEKKIRRS